MFGEIDTTPTAEALRYIRRLAAFDPMLDATVTVQVVSIDTVPPRTVKGVLHGSGPIELPGELELHLSDGTTIHLEVLRYTRTEFSRPKPTPTPTPEQEA